MISGSQNLDSEIHGDIWIVEIWTVKTGLGPRLALGYLLGL